MSDSTARGPERGRDVPLDPDRQVTWDDGAVPWPTVTRRYRQRPAGWWWVALLVVPLLLAGLGLFGGEPVEEDTEAQPAATTSAPPVVVLPPSRDGSDDSGATSAGDGESADADPTEALPSPFSLRFSGGRLTLAAQVPDETTAKELLAAVTASAGEGVRVVDAVEVVDGAVGPSPETIGGAAAAGAGALRDDLEIDLEIDWDGSALTLTGEVDGEGARAKVEDAALAAVPGAMLDSRLTVVDAVAACSTLAEDVARIIDATRITFVHDGATLSEDSAAAVAEIAELLVGCPDATVTVAGHTDSLGDADANLALSEKRARSVEQALVDGGVPEDQVEAVGLGEAEPVASNATSAGRAANRRVEISVATGE